MLGEHVDEADLARLLSETTDHVAVGIAPLLGKVRGYIGHSF